MNIFTPNTPLHDGAVVISNATMRVAAAGCLLPLTQKRNLSTEIGTRHRAGIGISENSDCFSIIVSEETGVISYAVNGQLSRFIDTKTLKNLLMQYLEAEVLPEEPKEVVEE
jgi:diadenylate cyclase